MKRTRTRIRTGARRGPSPPAQQRPSAGAVLRTAAVLCPLLLVALAGCRLGSGGVLTPEVRIIAATELPVAGTPLDLTVRVNPAPVKDLTYHVALDADGCVLPERMPAPQTITIAAGDQEATLTVRTEGVEIGADGCALTITLTAEGASDMPPTVKLVVLITVADTPQ